MAKSVFSVPAILAILCLWSPQSAAASESPAGDPQEGAACRPISVDHTTPEVRAILDSASSVTPVGPVQVEYTAVAGGVTRSSSQTFDITNSDGTTTKVTVVCKTGQCMAGCGPSGCDPGSDGKSTWCTACVCRPSPPAVICTPNSCTCEKTTTAAESPTTD